MLTLEEVRVLGNIANSTWGRSSTAKAPTMSLKCEIIGGEALKVSYVTLVTFASDHAMSQQMPALENEAVQVTGKYLAEIKKEFKAEIGHALKTKVKNTVPSVEMVSLQPHISPKRTAYYRHITFVDLG